MKAFPHMAKVHMLDGNSIIKEEITSGGMDLRDYFAAKAMPSVIENSNFIFDEKDYVEIAKISYQVADAMMKAREK